MSVKAIGLSGYASSGKTTAALYIEKVYGFERRHIAEPLRAMLAVLLKANGLTDQLITRYLTGDLKENVIPELGVTSRYAQITIGTEWGRDLISPDIWAKTWARGIGPGSAPVMNDSVRFPNEEAVIQQDMGGFTILIDRPGTKPVKFNGGAWLSKANRWLYERLGYMGGVHGSERIDLLQPDYVIENDGDISDLYIAIDDIMELEGIRPVKSLADNDNIDLSGASAS